MTRLSSCESRVCHYITLLYQSPAVNLQVKTANPDYGRAGGGWGEGCGGGEGQGESVGEWFLL